MLIWIVVAVVGVACICLVAVWLQRRQRRAEPESPSNNKKTGLAVTPNPSYTVPNPAHNTTQPLYSVTEKGDGKALPMPFEGKPERPASTVSDGYLGVNGVGPAYASFVPGQQPSGGGADEVTAYTAPETIEGSGTSTYASLGTRPVNASTEYAVLGQHSR
eukprot:m.88262 g.88262  ORF g.88262 m.88262 type:complete len:161 (-) comp11627_c0_seq1:132-614(-)